MTPPTTPEQAVYTLRERLERVAAGTLTAGGRPVRHVRLSPEEAQQLLAALGPQ